MNGGKKHHNEQDIGILNTHKETWQVKLPALTLNSYYVQCHPIPRRPSVGRADAGQAHSCCCRSTAAATKPAGLAVHPGKALEQQHFQLSSLPRRVGPGWLFNTISEGEYELRWLSFAWKTSTP